MILVPLYYQEVRDESVIVTGLLTGPQGIGMLLVMPLAGRLTQRFGGGRVALVGRLAPVRQHDPAGVHRRGAPRSCRSRSCCSCAVSASASCFMPAMSAAFASLRPEQLSDATPQLNVLQRIGGAIGTAVLAVVLQRASAGAPHPGAARAARSTPPTGGRWDRRAVADSLRGAAARREPTARRLAARRRQRRGGRRAARVRSERRDEQPGPASPPSSRPRVRAEPRPAERQRPTARDAADRAGPGVSPRVSQPQPSARARHAPRRLASSATRSSSC